MEYLKEELNRDYGKDVDSLIRIRDTAKIDLAKSRMSLLQMGVKSVKDGMITHLPGLNIDKYSRCENQEFYWEAEYFDGTVIKQFDGKKHHHYGNIEQKSLKLFRWISNFDDATDNKEKRVIVELDFETGKFNFMNGFVPQEIRAEVMNGCQHNPSEKKLIMRMIKRTSTSQSYPGGGVDEVSYYNRYIIGWEDESEKKILCVEPNGFVHLWME